MSDLTPEQKHKLMVAAKAFFDDGQHDPDYEFTDVNEQYEEFVTLVQTGGVSWKFIDKVYEMNTK